MDILKEVSAVGEEQVKSEDMALINALAQRELKPEEVYTFTVRLCDNEVDREWERFPRETLEELAGLFVGKSGIFDHNWSAHGQAARIYKTQVTEEDGYTAAGDRACYLKGWAYMLRTKQNAGLIAQIRGGITKEVSVGCAVEREVCSVCGAELGKCRHRKGRTYNGKLCWGELKGAGDAYEWSFVAVPAQRKAGVIKSFAPALKTLVRDQPQARRELEALERDARLGRQYLEELHSQVTRLAGLRWPGMAMETVRSITEKLEEDELKALRRTLEETGEPEKTRLTQLDYGSSRGERDAGAGAFLV